MYRHWCWVSSWYWVRNHILSNAIVLTLSLKRRATVYALAKRGPKAIYVTDLYDTELGELANDIRKSGIDCIPKAVDAASEKAVAALVKEAMDTYGRLDVFFANAGVATGTRLHDEDEESFMFMMRVNALR